ncbi:hypothetical protein U1Q18_036508 [Sarracenia purpurea var. burkii]
MMNALALCLVFSSLVTAGVWSPNPVKKNPTEDDVTVKDVHKVIVVEVDKEDGNTKVSISSQEADLSHKPQIVGDKKYMSDAKKKLSTATKDAVEVTQEKVEEASSTNGHGHSPGELVCNALGKCKHKVSEKAQEVKEHVQEAVTEVLGKAKEAVAQKTGDISDKAREVQEEAKNAVRGASESVKETASVKAQRIGSGAKEAVRGASEKGKETASVISRVVEESTKAMASKAKHGAETVLGTSKTVGKERATDAEQEAGEMAEEGSETVKGGANRQREGGEKELSEIFRRGREVAYDGLWYLASERTVGPLLGVIHLLGFATAYGMCMWVTFVSSYVLAAAMARQQFGVVQSKIYPVYFRAMAYSVTVALVGHLLGQRKRVLEDPAEMFQLYTLLASILLLLFNLLYLEPLATKVLLSLC